MSLFDKVIQYRYKYIPDHVIGEILTKPWIDNFIPFLILSMGIFFFGMTIPDFFSVGSIVDATRQLGEFGLVVLAMVIVMIAGGIDLSVSSIFALSNLTAQGLITLGGWPIIAVIPAVLLVGGITGLINGLLIGYLRLRAFLTTLVTLVIVRSVVDFLLLRYSIKIAAISPSSAVWDFIGNGTVLNIPFSFFVLLIITAVLHVVFSRMRPGWHIMAIGGARRSAYNAGIPVKRYICLTYVTSGVLVSIAGLLYAARLFSQGFETGVGLEIMAFTAAVVGGNSLGGGKGSAAKAFMGAIIILLLVNGLIRLGLKSGATSMFLGLMLLFAVTIDVRWVKNRYKILSKVYVSPTYFSLPPAPSTDSESLSPYALNDRLRNVESIGLGMIDGPEDVILDDNDNLYCGNRTGDIVVFKAPDYK